MFESNDSVNFKESLTYESEYTGCGFCVWLTKDLLCNSNEVFVFGCDDSVLFKESLTYESDCAGCELIHLFCNCTLFYSIIVHLWIRLGCGCAVCDWNYSFFYYYIF